LRIRTISNARISGFTRENVNTFFDLYEVAFDKINRQLYRIYNVDETGITFVQHRVKKIISVKEKKEVAALTSVERENLITTVICMNAVGNYIPSLIIWPRKHMKLELMDDVPSGSIWACHPSG